MKRVTFACVVYEKMRLNDGRYPIKLRVTYNAKSTLIGTSLYAGKEDLTYKGKLKDGSLKRQTEDLVRQFQDAAQKFNPTLFPDWTVTEVYDYVKKVPVQSPCILPIYLTYIRPLKGSLTRRKWIISASEIRSCTIRLQNLQHQSTEMSPRTLFKE